MNAFTAMLMDEQGAALVEYALVLAFLSAAAIVALTALGGAISSGLTNTAQKLTGNQSGG